MKMPQSIITKYQLTLSGEQVGISFMQNQLLYKSSLTGFEKVAFMECDLSGNPSNYITLYNKATKRYLSATPEYLNDMKIVDILKSVV